MYCRNCGNRIDINTTYCTNCGIRIENGIVQKNVEEGSTFGFAVLGFFVPVAGFVLFLVFDNKKPKRAKSAGKGALIGAITRTVLSVALAILYVLGGSVFLNKLLSASPVSEYRSSISEYYGTGSTDEILKKDADVTFGDFNVINNAYSSDTSLEVTVKNKSEKQCSFIITIEATDEAGMRIETDMVFADRLRPGQSVKLTAFKYVSQDQISQFQNATFKVLEIHKYNF